MQWMRRMSALVVWWMSSSVGWDMEGWYRRNRNSILFDRKSKWSEGNFFSFEWLEFKFELLIFKMFGKILFSTSLKLLYSRLVRATASVQYSKQCRWLILATLWVKRFFGMLRIKTGVMGKRQGCHDCWDPVIECQVAMLSLIFWCYLEIYSRFSLQQC